MRAVFSNFLGGLSALSENIGQEGAYAEARDMDPHRDPGFIMPGWTETELEDSNTGVLAGLIIGAVADQAQSNVYAIDSSKLYEITSLVSTFTDDGNFPHTVSTGKDVVFYYIGANLRLLYIQDTDIGLCNTATPTFDDDWGSTVPASAASLTSGPHPSLEWDDGILYIGNGRYLASLDGQTGANGTLNTQALDLQSGWVITSLFPTRNYIGICAWKKMSGGSAFISESRVFFWDGVSPSFNYWIPVEDNKITASKNLQGVVYLLTEGRSTNEAILRNLTRSGDETIRNFRFDKAGTSKGYVNSDGSPNILGNFENRLLIGVVAGDHQNAIFSYGSRDPKYPRVIAQPYSAGNDPSSGGGIGFVGSLLTGGVYASFYDDTYYYFSKFNGGASTDALFKCLYRDIGERVKINYVKFYFKTLVSGDSVTVSLDSDYGTANSLGTITYTGDGTITSKRFDLGGSVKCHSFRPKLDYTAGAVAFSKIVVDYDPTGDKPYA